MPYFGWISIKREWLQPDDRVVFNFELVRAPMSAGKFQEQPLSLRVSVSYGASIMEINAMIVNIARLFKLLEWSGVHARTLLPVGVIVAFFMPESGTFFKPAAPYLSLIHI